MEEEEEDTEFLSCVVLVQNNLAAAASMAVDSKIDHRTLPRGGRTEFDHAGALHCMNRDYLGPKPKFADRQFDVIFRVSRRRFQRLLEDFGGSGIPFFVVKQTANGKPAASLEARLLLPLKTLFCGVPTRCFSDCFQMSMTVARDCCCALDVRIFGTE